MYSSTSRHHDCRGQDLFQNWYVVYCHVHSSSYEYMCTSMYFQHDNLIVVLYSGKLSRKRTFAVLQLFVKVFLRKIWEHGTFGAAKRAICFLREKRIFAKVFSLESFLLYGIHIVPSAIITMDFQFFVCFQQCKKSRLGKPFHHMNDINICLGRYLSCSICPITWSH